MLAGERNEFTSIIDQIRGVPQEGDNVTLTIDANAQRVATQALQSAIASTPGRGGQRRRGGRARPLHRRGQGDGLGARIRPELARGSQGPQAAEQAELRRADRQPCHPEHLSAGLDDEGGHRRRGARLGRSSRPSSVLSGAPRRRSAGVPLSNAGGEQFGDIDMTTALTHSVNTYFAQVGEQLGTQTMVEYMKRFGFYSDPAARLPRRPDGAERRIQLERPPGHLGVRRRPGRDRPGRGGGPGPDHAAPDGGGGGDGRQRRQADAPDLRPAGHRSRTAG